MFFELLTDVINVLTAMDNVLKTDRFTQSMPAKGEFILHFVNAIAVAELLMLFNLFSILFMHLTTEKYFFAGF